MKGEEKELPIVLCTYPIAMLPKLPKYGYTVVIHEGAR